MNAEIISIGSELTAGRIADTNAAFIAGELRRLGFSVRRITVVGDVRRDIRDVIKSAARRARVVVATGGIGPTPDDLTREVVADLCGAPLVTVPEAEEHIRYFFARIGREPSPSNFIQSQIPEGAEWIPNPVGTAAAFSARLGPCTIFVLPGVPSEMKRILQESVVPRLRSLSHGVTVSRDIQVYGLGESVIGERLRDWMTRSGAVEVGTQASRGVVTVRITATGSDENSARAQLAEAEADIVPRLGDAVFDRDGRSLAEVVVDLLQRLNLRLAVAESCTGGELAARVTDVPGVSKVFVEGAVTYSNDAKVRQLGVPPDLIARHGAVSRPVAEAMARGMLEVAGADVALAVTGIAGPSGGSAEKPVGTVCLALADRAEIRSDEAHFFGERQQVRERAVMRALDMLRRYLLERTSQNEGR